MFLPNFLHNLLGMRPCVRAIMRVVRKMCVMICVLAWNISFLYTLHSAWIACPPITVVFNGFARAGEMIDERLSGLDKAKRKRKEKKVNP